MIRDIQLQRLAPTSQRISLRAVWVLAAFYRCRPDRLQPEHIRAYLHYLLVERKLLWSACNQVISGLKFFYTKILDRTAFQFNLPSQKKRKRLSQVLSVEELQRLFNAMRRPKADLQYRPGRTPIPNWGSIRPRNKSRARYPTPIRARAPIERRPR
ncbi:MAG: phage integrase N-terminal SAM-like domain-containing protein [Candidatus Tectomicrobia bacterium]|nr:phage integrase N-terminal SAM-like domain-containing protein [Candidatus Tectomicrobia bacterium]